MQHIGGVDDQGSLKSKGRSTKEGVGQKHEELWGGELYTAQIIASLRENDGTHPSVRQNSLL